jgi:hypothetical protein
MARSDVGSREREISGIASAFQSLYIKGLEISQMKFVVSAGNDFIWFKYSIGICFVTV